MIHQYQLGGYHIVHDVFSGSVHAVDPLAYDIIALYETTPTEEIISAMLAKYADDASVTREEILDCIADIEALKEQKKLFVPDLYEGFACTLKENSDVIKALCLHVAHTCNLACSYCFAAQGKYHGESALMPFEVGKQAIDFLIAHSGSRVNLEVDFFGGEPLMNWKVVKEIVAYARSQEEIHHKNFRFTLTTNGVLVDDEVIEFSNREMDNVVMSLDGRKEVHDRFRVTPNRKGSYDLVVPKFQKFAKARGDKSYYIRGTYTHHNTDFTNDILHMAELGFDELSMEPVVGVEGDPCALTQADLPVLFEQYEKLADEMLRREKNGNGFTFYHYMVDLERGPCIYKKISGCGSGTEYFAVTPQGELYPCHQFVNEPDYKMGNVWDGVTNHQKQDEFRHCNVYARPDCKDCWAKLYCSGGCAANAYHATGKINGTYSYGCELFKKRMECAMMMEVAKKLDPDFQK